MPLHLHFCARRRPERNPTAGSLSTAKLVPFFAAADSRAVRTLSRGLIPRFGTRLVGGPGGEKDQENDGEQAHWFIIGEPGREL